MGLYDITIQDVICKNALMRPDEVGFVSGHSRWTFSDYAREVDRLASGLISLGLKKGDRIGVLAFNSYEFFLLYGAAARLGAILLPINWRLKAEEVQMIVEDCTPKVMVTSPEYTDVAAALADRCPFVKNGLVIGEKVGTFRPIHDIMTATKEIETADVTQDDPFIIIPTAAVAGRPRGAVLTHGNLVAANIQNMVLMGIQNDAVYLGAMPLFHIMGLAVAFSAMHAGGRNVIMERFDGKEAAALSEQEHVTISATVPPMLSTILDEAEASGRSLASLRIVAGLFEDPETVKRFEQMSEARFCIGYGQTETSGYITFSPYNDQPGSIGKEVCFAHVRLVDDYDQEVKMGQPGEVVVRGPLVFKGYWNSEEETAYAQRHGWHHTGDIGRLDERGYLWYMKRKPEKELIKPGGENVYPAEVEMALVEHPDVLEACVFGIPDKEWGEAIKAVCTRKPGSRLEEQELIEFVGSRIARYKRPREITFVEALPEDEAGGVDREKVKFEHGAL